MRNPFTQLCLQVLSKKWTRLWRFASAAFWWQMSVELSVALLLTCDEMTYKQCAPYRLLLSDQFREHLEKLFLSRLGTISYALTRSGGTNVRTSNMVQTSSRSALPSFNREVGITVIQAGRPLGHHPNLQVSARNFYGVQHRPAPISNSCPHSRIKKLIRKLYLNSSDVSFYLHFLIFWFFYV